MCDRMRFRALSRHNYRRFVFCHALCHTARLHNASKFRRQKVAACETPRSVTYAAATLEHLEEFTLQ